MKLINSSARVHENSIKNIKSEFSPAVAMLLSDAQESIRELLEENRKLVENNKQKQELINQLMSESEWGIDYV